MPPRSGVRAVCAASLMVLCILAVLTLHGEENVAREATSTTTKSTCASPPCLTEEEREAAEHAGDEAIEEVDKEDEAIHDETVHGEEEEEHKALEEAKAEAKVAHTPHYGNNCLTLKAYAIASYDDLMDTHNGAVNILKPILRTLAEDPEHHNTRDECQAALDKCLAALDVDPALSPEGTSIARGMLEMFEHEMQHGQGILLSADLQTSGTDAAADRTLDQRDAVEAMDRRKGGTYIFIDAERVGWSGTPTVFQHLAVRAGTVDTAAREMAKTTEEGEVVLTPAHHKHTWSPSEAQAKVFNNWNGRLV